MKGVKVSKATDLTNVKELVHAKGKSVFADSLTIARHFRKRHDNILATIEKLPKDDFTHLNFKGSKYTDKTGRKLPMYYLTRDGFTILVMGFTGKKAYEWKKRYIQAFNTMEALLSEKSSHEWQVVRQKGIHARKGLSDALSEFVEYAKKQGSTKANFYYANVTRETYKALYFIAGREKVPSDFRDTLDNFDLASLQMAEYVAQGALHEGMIRQMYYKDIYKLVKEKVLIFASSIAVAKITKGIQCKLTN